MIEYRIIETGKSYYVQFLDVQEVFPFGQSIGVSFVPILLDKENSKVIVQSCYHLHQYRIGTRIIDSMITEINMCDLRLVPSSRYLLSAFLSFQFCIPENTCRTTSTISGLPDHFLFHCFI